MATTCWQMKTWRDAGLPALRDAMGQHGYDDALQRRLMCDNWLSALERIWH